MNLGKVLRVLEVPATEPAETIPARTPSPAPAPAPAATPAVPAHP